MDTGTSVALVTGGAGAIGTAVCHRLAAQGRAVVVADLDGTAAGDVARSLAGDRHRGVALDVTDTEGVRRIVAMTEDEVGPIDVLVNVAGWDRFASFVDTTPEFWDRVIDINYRGPLNTAHAVVPLMIARERGRIVSVASDAARVGSSLESIYSGAKGAVIAFSKSLAREVARYGITVNTVGPGVIISEQLDKRFPIVAEREAFIARNIPVGYFGEPKDLAVLVALLASPLGRYINGETMAVDGGLHRFAF